MLKEKKKKKISAKSEDLDIYHYVCIVRFTRGVKDLQWRNGRISTLKIERDLGLKGTSFCKGRGPFLLHRSHKVKASTQTNRL